LTAALHERLGAASSHGVDSSPAMISDAAAHATDSVTFALGDISTWEQPATYDIVYANAALQWVPDHPSVLGRWVRSLKPGGQIAVQVPSNADQATHRIAAELGAELLADPPPDPVASNVLAPEVYARVLDDLGCVDQHVRLQVYAHHLATTSDAVEWVKGTMLTRFKEPLGPDRWNEFVERFRERYVAEMGARSPYFFPFKRVLLWGRLA
jgi:trans-aconitate 2-methyltransferase